MVLPFSAMTHQQTAHDIINQRRIIEGPRDMLRSTNVRRYPWTAKMTKMQEKNRWFPAQANISRDVLGYERLPEGNKQAYKRALAFVSNLDAIQCDNLMENIYPYVTDPHIQQCLATQAAEEWIHVETYANMVETVVKDADLEIYEMYKVVPELGAKNAHIIQQGRRVKDLQSTLSFGQRFALTLVNNAGLEGIFFYSGFLTFYALGRFSGGNLPGTVESIKYIQRDEESHLWMFMHIWASLRQERPELFTPEMLELARNILLDCVNREISWGNYVLETASCLRPESAANYIKVRGNLVASILGLPELFPNQTHDVLWIDDYSLNGSHTNFFENRPSTYQHDKPTFTRRGRRDAAISDFIPK